MHTAFSKSILLTSGALLALACGNRTELLEPPWGDPDSGTAGGSAGMGGGGSAAGKGGSAGKGGAGGSQPVDGCAIFCAQCGNTIANCSGQCSQALVQVGAKCLAQYTSLLLCAVDKNCDPNVCTPESSALAQCLGGPH